MLERDEHATLFSHLGGCENLVTGVPASHLALSDPFFTQESRWFCKITHWVMSLLWSAFLNVLCWAERPHIARRPCFVLFFLSLCHALTHSQATLSGLWVLHNNLCFLLGFFVSSYLRSWSGASSHYFFLSEPVHDRSLFQLFFVLLFAVWHVFFSRIALLFSKYLFSTSYMSGTVLSPLGDTRVCDESGRKGKPLSSRRIWSVPSPSYISCMIWDQLFPSK